MDTSSELAVVTVDTTLRVDGTLDESNATELSSRLRRELVVHGAVVVDVSGLRITHGAAVHAFTEALTDAGEWPDVRLAVAGADEATARLLCGSRVGQRLVVRADVAAAAAALAERPDLVSAVWHFEVCRYAPGTARSRVRRVCDRWSVDAEVCESAEIVVTELVTNAVEHATSRSVVEVERRTRSFRMTVRDFDTSPLPVAVLPPPSSSRGRGLAMVAAVSREWGVHRHADGKTVWAEMATA